MSAIENIHFGDWLKLSNYWHVWDNTKRNVKYHKSLEPQIEAHLSVILVNIYTDNDNDDDKHYMSNKPYNTCVTYSLGSVSATCACR